MRSGKKIKLSFGQEITHYTIVFWFLAHALFSGFFFYKAVVTVREDKVEFLGFLTILFVFLSIVCLYYKHKNLYFEKHHIDINDDQFRNAILATALDLEWGRIELSANFAQYTGRGAWGTLITVYKMDDYIYVNSICDPSKRGAIAIRANKRNKEKLIQNFINVRDGIKVIEEIKEKQRNEEIQFWEESEWSLIAIWKRIIGYGLTLLFLLIGILCISEGMIFGIIFPILSIWFGGQYIRSDIQVIKEKRKRKKMRNKPS